MDYYFDIKIVPDDEVPVYFIRNKVYIKFHKALFSLKSTDIGISFPNYKVNLGNILRLHSTESSLQKLQATNWLGALSGYCDVSPILATPENVEYRIISRKQANMTETKLRRLIKRDSISQQEIKPYKAKMFTQGLDNAYFELESTSNKQLYRRYIQFGEITSQKKEGKFDSFGLSKHATVPIF